MSSNSGSVSRNEPVKLDLGPYYSDSQIKGARYLIIAPSDQPFRARIVAEVPDLVTARTIVDLWNASTASEKREPQGPSVWAVDNKTTFLLFGSEDAAKRYIGQYPASVSGGMRLSEMLVIS